MNSEQNQGHFSKNSEGHNHWNDRGRRRGFCYLKVFRARLDARLKAQPEFMSLIQECLAEIHWPMICSGSEQLIITVLSWFKNL